MLGFDKSFKAMADPTRRAILAALREGPLNAGEIAERLGIAANTLSFHLRILKDADLVTDQRKGQFIRYMLNTSVVDDLIRFLLSNLGNERPDPAAPPTEAPDRPADSTPTREDRS